MYASLIEPSQRRIETDLRGNPAAQQAEAERVLAYYQALADYHVLLGQLRATLAALVEVVRAPGAGPGLAELSRRSGTLLVDAEAARRAYATLRQPTLLNPATGQR